jgi:signal transduction histidine kinase
MRERTELAGGQWNLESNHLIGTTISINIPRKKAQTRISQIELPISGGPAIKTNQPEEAIS